MDIDKTTQTAIGAGVAAVLGAFAKWILSRARRKRRREATERLEAFERTLANRKVRVPPVCELSDPPPSDPPPTKRRGRT